LNNTYPWGFWISFDLFTGVAISSGAFVLAATVYILGLENFRPLLKPTILTALLGYLMVILALLVDLGRPERIWHMMIYWNHTSILLEIGVCVMSYTTVLAVEFAPVLFEGLGWNKIAAGLHKVIMPFVILGVVLSTLHQSSLGSLLLIQPAKLHPLWWTPILPVLFFVSSVSMGLAMIIFESSMSSRYFQRGLESHLLEKLARAIPLVLALYVLLRFGQLTIAGNLRYLFGSGAMSVLFWTEIVVGSIIPMIIFSSKENRASPRMLLVGALTLLVGMILNRFDVSWLGIHRLTQVTYVPSLMELSISAAIYSFGILAFGLAARYLPLFEDSGAPTLAPGGPQESAAKGRAGG
jgi:Ni/Fe-hydrogenase subunit HybB-like protein